MEIMDLTNNVFIPTTDYTGKVSWGKLSAVTRHDPGKQLYEIKTDSGRSVIVTESKSLLVWNNNNRQFKEKLTPEIKVGDYLPVTVNLCQPPTLLNDTHYSTQFKLNESNGIFIGILLSTGAITEDLIKITNTNKSINNFIKEWFNSNFVKWTEKENTVIGKPTALLTELLTRLTNKSAVTELLIAPESFIIGLLNGYFSVNGYINNDSIVINCVSEKLINSINILCSRIGVFSEIHKLQLIISTYWAKLLTDKITFLNENINNKISKVNINYENINDVVLDPIIEINPIDIKSHPKVYDLTIPSTFNFGLANGLQVRDTASTGYIQRQLIKGLEDLSIRYDGTNRNARGIIIQTVYGENGINQATQTELQLNILTMNNNNLSEKLGLSAEQIKKINKTLKIPVKDLNEFNERHHNKLKSLRDEMRDLQLRATINYKIMEEKVCVAC